MKYLSIFLFLVFPSALQASGFECVMSGIQYFPQQKEISLNPIFIIEGYAFSQKQIEALKEREVFLESDTGDKVILELQEILKGEMQLTQALFKPAQNLSPNNRYYLKVSAAKSENELENFERYNGEKKEWELIFWETSGLQHSAPLNSKLKIEFIETKVEFYGCGPEANAVFKISGKGDAEIWYKTEVEELSTGNKTTYYIREWKDRLYVGHGMCSGAFTYRKFGKYKVRFTPLNIDGNELTTTSWTSFDSPFLHAENPWGF